MTEPNDQPTQENTDGPARLRAADAHEWTGDGYACTTCWCSLHCPHCEAGCGGQGHLVKDDEGRYFHCQEPERWSRQTANLQRQRREASA